ncbi:hypothetical protein NW761_012114 [Fusarium oxysporum]|nr:hypothetical protein NW761_012114 [Fusarium oxysporum]
MLAAEQLRLLVGVCFVTCVTADAGDDFSNNLFSDLAPLLALFGERVTMQFMSQSMGWADNIILAMAPLGIITAIVGAIRVSGPSWLKAIIGRARETRAVAESELMSSTSKEVCELWNGQEIVRVMGEGPIREFIVLIPGGSGENGGKTTAAMTPTKAGSPCGTGSDSVEGPKNGRKVVPQILVVELKDVLKQKGVKGVEDMKKPFLTEYRPTLRERIFGNHVQPRHSVKETKMSSDKTKAQKAHQPCRTSQPEPSARDGHFDEDLEAQTGPDTREVLKDSNSKTTEEENPSVVIIRNTNADAPNLTLNVHNQVGRGELYVVAACGLVLQVGVLVYSGIAAKYLTFMLLKDGKPVADYAFPCTAAGTLLLVVGMLICAHVVESSTSETRYRPTSGMSARVVWLQRSGTVNDQVFESFAIFPNNAQALVTTSQRAKRQELKELWPKLEKLWLTTSEESKMEPLQNGTTQNGTQAKKTRLERFLETEVEEVIAVIGSMVSLCGFIVQFVGLRGMHWSVSVAQLGATIIMAILRAIVRRNLAKNPTCQPLLSGHEMDWLAMTTEDWAKAPWLHPSKVDGNIYRRPWADDGGWDWRTAAVEDPAELEKLKPRQGSKKKPPQVNDNGDDAMDRTRSAIQGRSFDSWSNADRVMKIRRDLGQLADWHGPASAEAISLARAIEMTMDALLGPESEGRVFTWPLKALKSSEGYGCESVAFHVKWHAGKWRAYSDEIEAALSLWLYSVDECENKVQWAKEKEQKESPNDGSARETEREGGEERPKDDAWLRKGTSAKPSLRLLGSHTAALRQDLRWWMPDGAAQVIEVEEHESANDSSTIGVEAHRIVGYASNLKLRTDRYRAWNPPKSSGEDASGHQAREGTTANVILATESFSPLKKLFAQHMFSAFIWAAAKTMKQIEDKADVRPAQRDGMSDQPTWQSIALHSTRLSKLAQDIQSTGLGSLEDVYLGIIPPLSRENKLPRANAIIEWAREHAKPHEELGHWKEAADVYLWLFRTAKMFSGRAGITTEAIALLMEYLRALADAIKLRKAQQFEERDIQELEQLQSELDNKLRNAGVEDIMARLMGLYEVQSRSWECSLVKSFKPLRDKEDMLNFTRLHWVAHENRDMDIELNLKASNMGVNDKDILDWTPLHYAAAKPSIAALRELLTNRANVNAQDIRGRTPLHYACRHSDAQVVQRLLREGATINIQDIDGMAPIHHAAMHGHSPAMQSLIEAGADVNLVDALGNTPLFWATYKGHGDLVKDLWKDSNMRLRDHNGRTPLHIAAMAEVDGPRSKEVVAPLLDIDAAKEEKDRFDAKDRFGRTPLHCAAKSGHQEVAALLLNKGAGIEARDSNDKTPLHHAAESGHQEVAALLLNKGAGVDARDSDDKTPLHVAAESGHQEVAALLLDIDAAKVEKDRFDAKDRFGRTPLHCAAKSGHQEVAALLLNKGAGIEARDSNDKTPLHHAAESGYQEVAALLLNKGAGVDAKDRFGQTPLHVAAESGHQEVAALLLDIDAAKEEKDRFDAKDSFGRTPLHCAAKQDAAPHCRPLGAPGGGGAAA